VVREGVGAGRRNEPSLVCTYPMTLDVVSEDLSVGILTPLPLFFPLLYAAVEGVRDL
jgi:hypothetical protein